MAEEEGFEPPIPFRVRQFSRLEPSTTRPLFRSSIINYTGNLSPGIILNPYQSLNSIPFRL
jgi:hypothetical protein